jgi:hypothetical protein
MVKTVSELESGVKNYRRKTKKQKMDLRACMGQVGGGHVAGWLKKNVAGWTGGWLVGWAGWLELPITIGSPRLPLSLCTYIYIYIAC